MINCGTWARAISGFSLAIAFVGCTCDERGLRVVADGTGGNGGPGGAAGNGSGLLDARPGDVFGAEAVDAPMAGAGGISGDGGAGGFSASGASGGADGGRWDLASPDALAGGDGPGGLASTGGTSGAGGAPRAGGTTGTGGAAATDGATGTGGAVGTGGTTATCQDGAIQCVLGTTCLSGTSLETCAIGADGCATAATNTCSSGLVCERYPPAACLDPTWAEWPMPNIQADVTAGAPNPASYTDNGDGTVTDNVTALMWQQAVAPGAYEQSQANAYCPALTLGGHNDWRLPTRIELLSIVDHGRSDPAIDTTYFPSTPSGGFWSSSMYPDNHTQWWFVRFGDGVPYHAYLNWPYGLPPPTGNVRCVR